MRSFLEIEEYIRDLERISAIDLPWGKLAGKKVMISGATGMVGKMLIDALMYKNTKEALGVSVVALGRNKEKARGRFPDYMDADKFEFVECDINEGIEYRGKVDFVLHLASSTHPKQYATEPVATVMANVIGLNNLLDFAVKNGAERFLFASSVEVYGENRGDTEKFDENYLGYINCNILRAGYPESKRAGEALCQAYREQYGIEVVVPRFARLFGPTMLLGDSKASSQFIMNAVYWKDIILKSEGTQEYSYLYVRDAVIGALVCLLKGVDGEAYNLADEKYDTTLKDLAVELAEMSGGKVIFELPDETERKGYSMAQKALMEAGKVKKLGFKVEGKMTEDLERTIEIIRQLV